jgi:hypothetical protein
LVGVHERGVALLLCVEGGLGGSDALLQARDVLLDVLGDVGGAGLWVLKEL